MVVFKPVKSFSVSLLSLFLLGACSSNEKKETSDSSSKAVSSEVVKAKDVSFQPKNHQLITPTFELTLLTTELKKDIDGKDSWFIYAEMENKSKETILPETEWNTYIRFSDEEKGTESLYPHVLPKKDLDGSEYKTAIDNMSKELKANQQVKIGGLYALPEDKEVYLSVYDKEMNVFHSEKLKIPMK